MNCHFDQFFERYIDHDNNRNMLKKAFKKLHISKMDSNNSYTQPICRTISISTPPNYTKPTLTVENAESTNSSENSNDIDPNSPSHFLNLPLDIMDMIIQHVSFRDRIALSVSARGLRYLRRPIYGVDKAYTPTETPTHPEECSRRISSRLMYQQPREYGSQDENTTGPYLCPYCDHPLCSPASCSSALMLDSATGIFFSPSLYRAYKAKFLYASSELEERKCKLAQGEYYSTVWCSHHRCPRDLLSRRRYQSAETQLGAERYLAEDDDMSHWGLTRLFHPQSTTPRARWLVGHRTQYPLRFLAAECGLKPSARSNRIPSPPLKTKLSKIGTPSDVLQGRMKDESAYQEPVYEKFWYTSYCLHCLLPLRGALDFGGGTNGPRCICDIRPRADWGGCRRCGIASVKITRIEAFDVVLNPRSEASESIWRSSRWLHLATECKIVETPEGPTNHRLVPVAGQSALDTALCIIRGLDVSPVTGSTSKHVSLQDLPYKIVRRIMLLHNRVDETKARHAHVMMAAYLFVKAWYGPVTDRMVRGALDRTDLTDKNDCWPHARPRNGPEPEFILGN
ncbi:hypothetical protein Dda_6701 [Drechslerella dactyloides]|uniref:F-box domain-containing protein n=1 Tax=Drechslerella dactyloides TaxID=74499 RepID=A0AAD6NJ53_DREDA|nr:hypothetical protein Dda_6701 [Drechslerella dactyloides]